jgi:hypothetical protein
MRILLYADIYSCHFGSRLLPPPDRFDIVITGPIANSDSDEADLGLLLGVCHSVVVMILSFPRGSTTIGEICTQIIEKVVR